MKDTQLEELSRTRLTTPPTAYPALVLYAALTPALPPPRLPTHSVAVASATPSPLPATLVPNAGPLPLACRPASPRVPARFSAARRLGSSRGPTAAAAAAARHAPTHPHMQPAAAAVQVALIRSYYLGRPYVCVRAAPSAARAAALAAVETPGPAARTHAHARRRRKGRPRVWPLV